MGKMDAQMAAPDFRLRAQDGSEHSLAQHRGRKVLLYFYPKADTPGCTTQACTLRDALSELSGLGVDVIGISPDAPEKQQRFDKKHRLGFPLLSDADHAVADAYGAWGEKSMYGKTYEGVIRSAFLIDEEQRISQVWYKVKPKETAANVLRALKEG
jgi:peroxiredoxin Q/BCP